MQRGAGLVMLHHVGQSGHATGGQGVHGAGADGVDANLARAEVVGEVADRRLKRGLGHAHDVIVGHDARGAEVGHGDDAAAVFSMKGSAARERPTSE